MPEGMKRCANCGGVKPPDAFHRKRRSKADGAGTGWRGAGSARTRRARKNTGDGRMGGNNYSPVHNRQLREASGRIQTDRCRALIILLAPELPARQPDLGRTLKRPICWGE